MLYRKKGIVMYRLKVKDVAFEKKLSQRKLCRLADIDIRTLKKIYKNPTGAVVTIETLDKLAMALEVDIRELVESVKEPITGFEPIP